jgi:hypothetical protein
MRYPKHIEPPLPPKAGTQSLPLPERGAGQRAVTPETALRPAGYVDGSAAIRRRLQIACDLSRAEAELAAKIAAEVTPAAA